VFSATLCGRLNAIEEARWGGWNGGTGIVARDIAHRLRGFGIESKQVRIGDESRKGYDVRAFDDAFARYLPAQRNRGNTGNIPTRRVSNVSPVSQNVESATIDAVDSWLSREFAALNPDADDHGLRVARLRAEAVRRRRGASAVEPLCPYPPSAQLDFGEK
jgi:hypothetical protein